MAGGQEAEPDPLQSPGAPTKPQGYWLHASVCR